MRPVVLLLLYISQVQSLHSHIVVPILAGLNTIIMRNDQNILTEYQISLQMIKQIVDKVQNGVPLHMLTTDLNGAMRIGDNACHVKAAELLALFQRFTAIDQLQLVQQLGLQVEKAIAQIKVLLKEHTVKQQDKTYRIFLRQLNSSFADFLDKHDALVQVPDDINFLAQILFKEDAYRNDNTMQQLLSNLSKTGKTVFDKRVSNVLANSALLFLEEKAGKNAELQSIVQQRKGRLFKACSTFGSMAVLRKAELLTMPIVLSIIGICNKGIHAITRQFNMPTGALVPGILFQGISDPTGLLTNRETEAPHEHTQPVNFADVCNTRLSSLQTHNNNNCEQYKELQQKLAQHSLKDLLMSNAAAADPQFACGCTEPIDFTDMPRLKTQFDRYKNKAHQCGMSPDDMRLLCVTCVRFRLLN